MTSLETFVQDFAVELVGCPRPLMERTARDGLRDLCERLRFLRQGEIVISVVEDEAAYSLTLPTGYDLVGITRVDVGDVNSGRSLEVTSESGLAQQYGITWKSMRGAIPTSVYVDSSKRLVVFPRPSADFDQDLIIEAAVKPALTVTSVDDILYTDYHQAVADYCRWRLMAIPGQPWSNEKLAAYYQLEYERAVTTAQARLLKNFSGRPLRVKPRSFLY